MCHQWFSIVGLTLDIIGFKNWVMGKSILNLQYLASRAWMARIYCHFTCDDEVETVN
jgi:hypothetical protein